MPRDSLFGSSSSKKKPKASFQETQSLSKSVTSKSSLSTSSSRTPGKKLFKRLFCGPIKEPSFPDQQYQYETELEGPIDSNSTAGSPDEVFRARSVSTSLSTVPSSTSGDSVNRRLDRAATNGNGDMTVTPQDPTDKTPSKEEHRFRVSAILAQQGPMSTRNNTDENYASPSNIKTLRGTGGYGMPMMKTPGMAIPTPQTKRFADDDDNEKMLVFPHPLRTVAESPQQMELTRHVNLSRSISESQETGGDQDDDDAFLPDDFKQTNKSFTWDDVQRYVREAEINLKREMEEKHQKAMDDYEDQMEKQLQVHGKQWKEDADEEYARLNKMLKLEKSRTQHKHMELLRKISAMAEVEAQLFAETEKGQEQAARVQALEAQLEEEATKNDSGESEVYIGKLEAQVKALQSDLDNFKTSHVSAKDMGALQKQKYLADGKVEELEHLVLKLQSQLKTMEVQQSKSNEDNSTEALKANYEKEIEEWKAKSNSAKQRISMLEEQLSQTQKESQSLQSEMEELIILRSENAAMDRNMNDMNEQLKSQKQLREEQTSAQSARLQEAQSEIESLQRKLVEHAGELKSSASLAEELVAAKTELQAVQSERRSLLSQVEQLESSHSSNLEKVREDLLEQIDTLKAELDKRDEAFQKEKRTLQADLSVSEIEELTSEVKGLKDQHRIELEKQQKALAANHEAAQKNAAKRLAELRSNFEEEIRLLEEGHEMERKSLQAEIAQLKEQFAQEYSIVQAKSKEDVQAEIQALQEKLDKLRIEYEDEKIEIIRTSSRQADELQVKLSEQQQEHEEALESMKSQLSKLEEERERLQAEVAQREKNVPPQFYIDELEAKYSKDLEDRAAASLKEKEEIQMTLSKELSEKSQLEGEVTALREKLSKLNASHEEELRIASEKAKQSMEKELRSLEQTLQTMSSSDSQRETDREEFNRRIRDVRSEHNKEIEDLMKQLDLVEAEHNQKTAAREKVIVEKETVITALGTQLAEAEKKYKSASEGMDQLTRDMRQVREELDKAKSEIDGKSGEIRRIVAAHEKAMKEEKVLREKMCDEAREEMIQRAEVQFEHANLTYKKLKHEFDAAMAKVKKLEKELKTAKANSDESQKKMSEREASLAAELSKAKAAIASNDLETSRKVQEYQVDLERAKQAEADLQKRLDEAVATSQSVQKTLATIAEEKNKLVEENKEMKSVCEELMDIVENGK